MTDTLTFAIFYQNPWLLLDFLVSPDLRSPCNYFFPFFTVFGSMEMSYRVPFTDRKTCKTSKREDEDEEKPDGPIVERQCPQCKNDKMSYATLQLRSADEGQTVFFTCTKCK